MTNPAGRCEPKLGESLDHYGEAYCTRAVNCHEELLKIVKIYAESLVTSPTNRDYLNDLINRASGSGGGK